VTSASISGTTVLGNQLTASTVSTDGTPTANQTWQWQRCDSAGASCVAISGATASTYVLTRADIDLTIRVVSTRTNTCSSGCGPASATSAQTAVIQGITMVGSNVSTGNGVSSVNVTTPAGTQAGHVLVAQVTVRDGTNQTVTPPAGWTLIANVDNGTNIKLASYYKVATAGEPAGYTYTWTTNADSVVGIFSFDGASTTTPVDVFSTGTGGTSSVVANSVTTTGPHRLLIGMWGARMSTTFVPPAGMTERWDAGSGNASHMAATEPWPTASATGTRTATISGGPPNASQLIALLPKP